MTTKQINENVKPTGLVTITQTNSEGKIVKEFQVPNLVVTAGKNHIAAKIAATTNSPASMTHMAIGTGTSTPGASDTGLGTQTGRVSLSGSVVSTNTITYTATFPAGTGDGAITEAGVFNASSGGTMLCRTTFPVVNKASGDTIAVTWVVTVS
jgi:Phage tail-collar fibre protein